MVVVPLNISGSIMHVFKYLHQSSLDIEVHQSIVLVFRVSFKISSSVCKDLLLTCSKVVYSWSTGDPFLILVSICASKPNLKQ